MKCSCGRLSYRPDPVTTRRPAERCFGCHRITGRCSCAPIYLGGPAGPEYVPAIEAEASAVPEGLREAWVAHFNDLHNEPATLACLDAILALAATPAKAEGYTGEGTLTANPDGTATLTPAKAEGLDVERLARALAEECFPEAPEKAVDQNGQPWPQDIEWAKRVAAIYARLADTATEGEDR